MGSTLCRYLLGIGLLVGYPAKLIYNFVGVYRKIFVLDPWMGEMRGMVALAITDGLITATLIIGSIWAGLIVLRKFRSRFRFVFALLIVAGLLSVSYPVVYWLTGVDEKILDASLRNYSSQLLQPLLFTLTGTIFAFIVWRDLTESGTSREASLDPRIRLHRAFALLAVF